MGKTGQFAEKQTAAVQSAGFEKFKTVMSIVSICRSRWASTCNLPVSLP